MFLLYFPYMSLPVILCSFRSFLTCPLQLSYSALVFTFILHIPLYDSSTSLIYYLVCHFHVSFVSPVFPVVFPLIISSCIYLRILLYCPYILLEFLSHVSYTPLVCIPQFFCIYLVFLLHFLDFSYISLTFIWYLSCILLAIIVCFSYVSLAFIVYFPFTFLKQSETCVDC